MELVRFTTDSYPETARCAAWSDAIAPLGWHVVSLAPQSKLYGMSEYGVSASGYGFASLASTSQTIQRQPSRDDALTIVLLMDGEATLQTEGRNAPLNARDIVFVPSDHSARIAFASGFRAFIVCVPRAAISTRLMPSLWANPALLPCKEGICHVFSGFLASVAGSLATLSNADVRPLEVAITEFLVSSLAGLEQKGASGGLKPAQAAIFLRLCNYVESNLGDPELSVNTLAQEERVSPRYVQKLFEASGQSFSAFLRARRLERCRADLVDPLYEKSSVSDICFRWGFNDPAHFSRLFRERYGASPRTFRQDGNLELSRQLIDRISRGLPINTESELMHARRGETDEGRRFKSSPAARDSLTIAPTAPAVSSSPPAKGRHHLLRATAETVHWGYFSSTLPPVLEVDSGDRVTVETLSQHAADDWERMIAGDAGAESVFHWTADKKNIDRRGAGPMDASIYGRGAGEGFGVHILTGPIAVRGAEPGDVLEVRIVHTRPRRCANPTFSGRAFGSNAATWWGMHYRELLTEPKPREVVTIYEIDQDLEKNASASARAVYNYRWTPQRDPFGVVHKTIDYPGVPVDHTTVVKNFDILKNVKIPVRPHFGVIGVAPQQQGMIDSVPPSAFGGNLDNWRVGPGASVYLPVGVAGALLSIGDPHASQGDSELCGTAIECSLTGDFELILHKKASLRDQPYADLTYPLVETKDEWVLHGFSHPNYLVEFGKTAQSDVYQKSTLDQAMRDAFIKTRRFLMSTKGFSEDEAISLISVAVDFGVTQVVDGNRGVHAIIRKALFEG